MIDKTQVAFFDRLCASFPALRKLREESEEENSGEFLSYVFMGKVARYARSEYRDRRRDKSKLEALQLLMNFMEAEFDRGSDPVCGLIQVGFLEGLQGPPEPDWRVRELLGPRLRTLIEETWPSRRRR